MKVYRVKMSYFDGDHDHGTYESPLFLSEEDAKAFREQVMTEGDNKWESSEDFPSEPYIEAVEVLDGPANAGTASLYLNISYT